MKDVESPASINVSQEDGDVQDMKQTWTNIQDVNQLQQQGIQMTLLYLQEKKQTEILQKQLNECIDEADNLLFHKDRLEDVLFIYRENMGTICSTIHKIFIAKGDELLCPSLEQIKKFVGDINDKHNTEMKTLHNEYLRRLKETHIRSGKDPISGKKNDDTQ